MNITKKAAIRNASVCDAWGLRGPASAIKALSDERDALQAENEKLRAALDKISKLNARRDRYSQEVEDVIIAARGEKE